MRGGGREEKRGSKVMVPMVTYIECLGMFIHRENGTEKVVHN